MDRQWCLTWTSPWRRLRPLRLDLWISTLYKAPIIVRTGVTRFPTAVYTVGDGKLAFVRIEGMAPLGCPHGVVGQGHGQVATAWYQAQISRRSVLSPEKAGMAEAGDIGAAPWQCRGRDWMFSEPLLALPNAVPTPRRHSDLVRCSACHHPPLLAAVGGLSVGKLPGLHPRADPQQPMTGQAKWAVLVTGFQCLSIFGDYIHK